MAHSKLKIALVAVAAIPLGGCAAFLDYGAVGVGYDDPYYYDSYYDASWYGWYDDYYYPGVGIYVYDQWGSRHRWRDHHRHYWEGRRGRHGGHANWSGYSRGNDGVYRDQRRRHRDGDRHRGERREQRKGFGLNPDRDVRSGDAYRDQRGERRDRGERRGDRRGNRSGYTGSQNSGAPAVSAPPARQPVPPIQRSRPPRTSAPVVQQQRPAPRPAVAPVQQRARTAPAPVARPAPAARPEPTAENRPKRTSPRSTTRARKQDD